MIPSEGGESAEGGGDKRLCRRCDQELQVSFASRAPH